MTTMGRRTVASRGRRGFTLVELVAVLAIIAVAAAIAAPRYIRSIIRYRVDAAARRVAGDLTYARSRARSLSASRTVTFNNASDSYALSGETDPIAGTGAYSVGLRDEPYRAFIHSMDLGGDNQVVFDGFGMPDADGAIVIRAGDVSRAVEIDAATGEITVGAADADFVSRSTGKGLAVTVN